MFLRALIAFAFLPTLASAAFYQEDVQKKLAGRYKLEVDDREIQFVIRSAGNVEIITDEEYNISGKIVWNYSDNDHDGLPIADVIITLASDEDAQEYHLLLTVVGESLEGEIYLLGEFSTFNDGPNDIARADVGGMVLSKYNKDSKRFEVID